MSNQPRFLDKVLTEEWYINVQEILLKNTGQFLYSEFFFLQHTHVHTHTHTYIYILIDWLIDFILQCTWKTKFLGTSSKGFFRTPSDRISHCIHTVRTSFSQLPAISGIFCLLVEFVYWPCGLKICVANDKLGFLKLKSGFFVKILLGQFWIILSPNKVPTQNIFPILSKALWWRINCCYMYYF